MAPPNFLLPLLLLLLVAGVATDAQSNDFIFNGFSTNSNLSVEGIAGITPTGVLQLTNDSADIIGRAFYPSPLRFLDNRSSTLTPISFSTAFVLQILKAGTGGGHGLAFTLSPTRTLSKPGCCPYLGLFGAENNGNKSNHILAVEFDTAHGFGFTVDDSHVGVDVNSIVAVAQASPPAYYDSETGKMIQLNFLDGDPLQAWVDYDGKAKLLNVTISPLNVAKPARPLISHPIDITSIVNEFMYVGFSASTGKLVSSHYVSGWSFKMNGEARALDLSALPFPPRPSGGSSGSGLGSVEIVAITFAGTVVVVTAVIAAILYLRRRARLAETIEDWEMDYPHRFPYKTLYKATKGFKDSELLGTGGFGHVYKGVLPHTEEQVAVKRVSNKSQQGVREFVAEISSLGRLRHRHLVPLQGWCKRQEELLLVYEFMPNGSLDMFLFEDQRRAKTTTTTTTTTMGLSWQQRHKILKGIAMGLLYLHEEWEQVVVHRDVKASNVMLDAEMNGRLGDFGLARLYEHGKHPHTTHVVGTLGYMAPELSRTGKATASSDVFAYGTLLLEVACGRRPIEISAEPRKMLLLDWVKDCYARGQLFEVVDPQLGEAFDKEEMKVVLMLGLVCSQSAPECRPTMRQVTQYLNGDDYLDDDLLLQFSEVDSLELTSRSNPLSSLGGFSTGSLQSGR